MGPTYGMESLTVNDRGRKVGAGIYCLRTFGLRARRECVCNYRQNNQRELQGTSTSRDTCLSLRRRIVCTQ